MTAAEISWIALVLIGAMGVFLQVRLIVACLTSDKLGTRSKVVAAIVPIFTPFLAWYAGKRVEPLLWFLSIASYTALWILVSVRA